MQEQVLEIIAEECYNINTVYGRATGKLMDNRLFRERSDQFRESLINAVDRAIMHKDPDAEAFHLSWYIDKKEAGWKHGDYYDAEQKRHPDLMPFELLPMESQVKSHLFIQCARSMHQVLYKAASQ